MKHIKQKECPCCQGDGLVSGAAVGQSPIILVPCPNCGGTGTVLETNTDFEEKFGWAIENEEEDGKESK